MRPSLPLAFAVFTALALSFVPCVTASDSEAATSNPAPPLAPPRIHQTDNALSITLANGVTLDFALTEGIVLGLQRIRVHGVAMSRDDTVLRPFAAEEWRDDRALWDRMRLVGVHPEGAGVRLELAWHGTRDPEAFRQWFVFHANVERARAEEWPDGREADRQALLAAEAVIESLLRGDGIYRTHALQVEKLLAQAQTIDTLSLDDYHHRQALARAIRARNKRGAELRQALATDSQAYREAQATREHLLPLLMEQAERLGDIHRDFYRFALPRLPVDICTLTRPPTHMPAYEPELEGVLHWFIEPVDRNIAGWMWSGFRQAFAFTLPEDRRVNVFRLFGTWEVDGTLPGSTVVAMRYRGLGRIEQAFTPAGSGGVQEAFMTSDILPGAAGEGMAVSPAVPGSAVVGDRGYALRHRVGAWIALPGRGAGSPFVDFQYRSHAALARFHEAQGNLRSLTEAYPGDAALSQTEEEWFPLTHTHRTQAQVVLALTAPEAPLTANEWRTRWREVDQHVRDLVSEELGFVQQDPLPGFGMLKDFSGADAARMPEVYEGMTTRLRDSWAAEGVRLIASHNPGLVSGRFQGPEGPPRTYGGVCNIYEWMPTADVVGPWRAFMEEAAKRDVAYYVWIGQTQVRHAPFAERVGLEPAHWALNAPGDEGGAGYGSFAMKGNILHPAFAEAFTDTLQAWRDAVGYDGFWADSFHNLFMSQLDWASGTGAPMQRAWWEWFAARSREGVALMSESMAFPGISCSIEVRDWERDTWAMQHVWKWYRGHSQLDKTPEEHDETAFRLMAAKGWAAPDLTQSNWYREAHRPIETYAPSDIIPSFARFAHAYLAALPLMQRSYLLEEDAGVLWLPKNGNEAGVWFAFRGMPVPEGVRVFGINPVEHASSLADAKTDADHPDAVDLTIPLPHVRARHVYRVEAEDLPARFSIRLGNKPDPRVIRQ